MLNLQNNRLKIIALVGGIIYSIAAVLGRQIYLYGGFQNAFSGSTAKAKTIISIIAITIVVATLLYLVFLKYLKYIASVNHTDSNYINEKWIKRPIKLWLITWVILFVCWLPCYLAYFPGLLSYDAPEQICMITGVFPNTTHQPPIHTIILGWSMSIGEAINAEPIVIYTIWQMIVVTAFYSYFVVFLVRHFAKKNWQIVLLYLYFAINPIMPLMAIQPTKDTLFTCFFITCTFLMYELVTYEKGLNAYKYVLLIIFMALTAVFRNNAVYALILAFVIMVAFVKMKRGIKVKAISCIALVLLVVQLFNSYTTNILGYAKLDDKVEMSAVPASQIALVLKENAGSITEEEWTEISFFIKDGNFMVDTYNPRFYDPLKDAFFKTNLQENYGRFLKLWIRLFKEYPGAYIRAFLNLNIPYWYPFSKTIDPYSNRVYIETNIGESPYVFERASKLPWLLGFYESVANYSLLDKPIIRILFAINTPIWFVLLGVAFLIAKKDYKKIVVFLPAIFLWGTYLLGPVSNFRYVFPIVALYPFIFGVVFEKISE